MGFNVPVINRDSDWCREWFNQTVKEPKTQKRLVLVIVSIALLLDNMLYMVIVPIIPQYLRDIHAYDVQFVGYHNETKKLKNGTLIVRSTGGKIDYLNEDIELGWLFASKALIQIFVNPFSGYIIDRIGYEFPMVIGLCVMFSSTAIFALGRSYGILFFARSLQVSNYIIYHCPSNSFITDLRSDIHLLNTILFLFQCITPEWLTEFWK